MKKRTVVIIVVVVLVALLAGAYLMFGGVITSLFQIFTGGMSEQVLEMPALNEVVTVERGDITDSIKVLGSVQSPAKASLNFNVDTGTVAEVFVRAGDVVEAGDLVAQLDSADLEEAVEAATKELEDAESELEEAREPVTETDLAERQLALQQAETSLDEAEDALAELKEVDLQSLQLDVKIAEENLTAAQVDYARLQREDIQTELSPIEWQYDATFKQCAELSTKTAPNEHDIQLRWVVCNEAQDGLDKLERVRLNRERALMQGEYAVAKAERALDNARKALEEVSAGPDSLELAEAEHALAEAQVRIIQAREDLDEALAGPDATVLSSKEMAVKRAQLTLESAESELENAVLTAPIGGRITVVNVIAGDRVTSHTTIVEMADFEDLRIQVDVDETQIPDIFEGQSARVILDGLPDEVYLGSVQAIPLQGNISSGIVTYPVSVVLDDIPPGLRLGMTAEVEFILASVEDVLLVPAAAIRQLPDGTVVTVVTEDPMNGGRLVERRYVTTGRSNGIYIEIVEGLNEGEQIEVQYEMSQSQFTF